MRRLVRDFVAVIENTLHLKEPIYEFGSFQVPGQESFSNLRTIFPHKKYVGCDMREGPGVDLVVDLHNVQLPSNCAGSIICVETLEHVEFLREALFSMYRLLQDGGILILTSVFLFPIHEYPNDFWRFTPAGFKSLLKDFQSSFVISAGTVDTQPHSVAGIGIKGFVSPQQQEAILKSFADWKRKWVTNA